MSASLSLSPSLSLNRQTGISRRSVKNRFGVVTLYQHIVSCGSQVAACHFCKLFAGMGWYLSLVEYDNHSMTTIVEYDNHSTTTIVEYDNHSGV